MAYVRLARHLPSSFQTALFGDRARHGPVAADDDQDWQLWRKIDLAFYDQNQRTSVGSLVNTSGYRIMKRVSLEGLTVLEIGPGNLDHISQWRGKPTKFIAIDINEGFLRRATDALERHHVPYEAVVTSAASGGQLDLESDSVDVVLSFYSLEHLHPLGSYTDEAHRVLKPGGRLVGAIPCEGGIGWGLGRYLTTRKWLLANGISDPGKIISWEHPNFADTILSDLSEKFVPHHVGFWPFVLPVIDLNLVATFVMMKSD
ncbi:MAG: class I SAM-dependent methyltransferase [Roseitalea sp.]|jgi:SAM-dependent methyltransferase|nr:class I SAM-dependent methyltransferase [Roseitalea sp.]MBO6722766.1 class I SAM-dependent methyltransferase [Roseitalea sp.]MBO6745160.1 class I SAM-dependent methyltransferase [Roseitalea sp.]